MPPTPVAEARMRSCKSLVCSSSTVSVAACAAPRAAPHSARIARMRFMTILRCRIALIRQSGLRHRGKEIPEPISTCANFVSFNGGKKQAGAAMKKIACCARQKDNADFPGRRSYSHYPLFEFTAHARLLSANNAGEAVFAGQYPANWPPRPLLPLRFRPLRPPSLGFFRPWRRLR